MIFRDFTPKESITFRSCVEIASRRGEPECIPWPHNVDYQVSVHCRRARAYNVICALAHGQAPLGFRVKRCTGRLDCVNPDHMHWVYNGISPDDIVCIRLLARYHTISELARVFKITAKRCRRIIRGLSHGDVPMPPFPFDLQFWREILRAEEGAA